MKMSGRPSTLYEQCLQNTAELLRSGSYWNTELPMHQNPFSVLPSSIIDALITCVTRLPTLEPLSSLHLRLLLTSGRVTRFIIDSTLAEEVMLDGENLYKMLMDLSTSCRALTTLEISFFWLMEDYEMRTAIPALNTLLSKAVNLKCVVSSLYFDFNALCNSSQLEKMVINFCCSCENPICDVLKLDGQFKKNTCLKHIEVCEGEPSNIPREDVAVILKYCPELVYAGLDILQCLEYLHAEELRSGSLAALYKIQKCRLGNERRRRYATNDAVRIATITCPDLRELNVCVSDFDPIPALSDCQNLMALAIRPLRRDLVESSQLQHVLNLPEVGYRLKELDLNNVSDYELHIIGDYCPNLEAFKMCYYRRRRVFLESSFYFSPTDFRKLLLLHLKHVNGGVDPDVLVGILSNATNLEDLTLVDANTLTDDRLNMVLKENCLSNLKNICMNDCGLSLSGVRKLACTARNLQNLKLNRGYNFFDEIVDLFQEINPHVNVLPRIIRWF